MRKYIIIIIYVKLLFLFCILWTMTTFLLTMFFYLFLKIEKQKQVHNFKPHNTTQRFNVFKKIFELSFYLSWHVLSFLWGFMPLPRCVLMEFSRHFTAIAAINVEIMSKVKSGLLIFSRAVHVTTKPTVCKVTSTWNNLGNDGGYYS